jgi:hypothetical protein
VASDEEMQYLLAIVFPVLKVYFFAQSLEASSA